MDNIQKCEKTIYHYIYENNPKAEELKRKIAEIKSHRTPTEKEDDVYHLREPWRKFGCVGGFVMGWGWFRDEYIYAKATENDVEMAYNEIKGGDLVDNIERYFVKQTETGFVICEINKTIPLPFNFIKKQTADDCAKEFNKYGKIAVAKYYYISKVAGNRILSDYKYAYEKWLVENYKNFDW